jgi:hypothetical protein
MTQAFNLSQLANNLDSSGRLDATDGLVNAVPVTNGGTGVTAFASGALLKGAGTSSVTVASSADIVGQIGTTAVANATNATNATNSTNAVNATNAINATTSASCSGNSATATALTTASGSAPSYSARAWVNFDGTTASIRASGNVSSITYNSTGVYTINFLTALPDTNYAYKGTAEQQTTGSVGAWMTFVKYSGGVQSTTALQIATLNVSSYADGPALCVSIFR